MHTRSAAARGGKAVPWLGLGILLSVALLSAAFFLWQRPSFGKVSYLYQGKQAETGQLPLSIPTGGERLSVLVPLRLGFFRPATYRVVADDCLEDLFVNDARVPRELTDFCDYTEGRPLNLSPYLRGGENLLQFTVRDNGGMGGVDIRPVFGDVLTLAFIAVLLACAAAALLLLRRRAGPWLAPLAAACAASFVSFLYWLATSYTVRGHDTEAHIEYVQYMMQNLRVPPAAEGWQYYQPPLYYAVAAAWGKAADAFSAPLPGSLQLLSFILFLLCIACILWIGSSLFEARSERAALSLFIASAALLPGVVFFAARINNDVLAFALSLLCTALLLRWWRQPGRGGLWTGIAVILSLGILTKSTTIPLIAAAWILLLFSPLRWRKKLGLWAVSIAVILLFTDWLFIQRFLVEGNDSLIGNLGNLHSGLRLRNFPAAFLRFNPLSLFGHPYNNPWEDAAGRQFLWEYVFRSAFSGEWSFGPGLRPLVSALHLLGLFALLLALLGIVRHFRQETRRSLPLLLTLAFFLAAIAANRFMAPYGSSQDFRYIAPVAVPLAYFAVRGALALPRLLRLSALVLLAALPLGSALLALSLVFSS